EHEEHHELADQGSVPRLHRLARERARRPAHVPRHRHDRQGEEGRQLQRRGARVSSGASVALEDVQKSFESGRVRALRGVSFRIEAGEFVALTGASGSGKSTLLNLIGALDRPDAGTIVVGGLRLDELARPSEYRAATI